MLSVEDEILKVKEPLQVKVFVENKGSYRDTLSIVSNEGKRKWVYAKKPKGKLYNARTYVSIVLLSALFGTPFIKISGHPFMMFNIIDRKFILFGFAFGPHDFYLIVLAMISFIVFVILFTVIFGRVFCGWACPQTVFLEMVFRKIEYFIEGNQLRQKLLNDGPWNAKKIFKKGAKYSIFFTLAVIIANTFLSWIIGADEVMKIIHEPIATHRGGFISMLLFSGAFYFVFAYFREYACIYVCPYGRLQGVLLDKSSMVVAYDYNRGEPRGKIKKSEERAIGDCIDCKECVSVCPTGIDIRNGTQLECVNCTACIDSCNNVMAKINKPLHLIKFSSEEGIKTGTKFKVTSREIGYSIVLVILLTILAILLTNRNPIDVTILRMPGMLYQEQPDGMISNLYTIKLTNKTFDLVPVNIKAQNPDAVVKLIGENIQLQPNDVSEAKFLILFAKDKIKMMNTSVNITVMNENNTIEEIKTNFLGPNNQNK